MNVIHRAPLMGGSRAYLLNDDFLDDRAAGAINGTPATPGPGTRAVVDTYASTELITNGGFETVTSAGPPADFTSWADTVGDGQAEVATGAGEVHGGTNACKLTGGETPSVTPRTYQAFVAIPGRSYTLTFWTRGDGTHAGRYNVYDATNSADILPNTSTGVTGTTYQQVSYVIAAPAGCLSIRVTFRAPDVNGGFAYFDDVSCLPTTGLLSISGA